MGQLILHGLLHSPLESLIAIDLVPSRLDLARQSGVSEAYHPDEVDPQDLRDREIVDVDT